MHRNALKIFLLGFIGLLISHFTTNQIFGLYTFSIMLSIYLYISDHYMKESKRAASVQETMNTDKKITGSVK